jgi:hypothetical protein
LNWVANRGKTDSEIGAKSVGVGRS